MVKYVVTRVLGGKILEPYYYNGKEYEIYAKLIQPHDLNGCYEISHGIYNYMTEMANEDMRINITDICNTYTHDVNDIFRIHCPSEYSNTEKWENYVKRNLLFIKLLHSYFYTAGSGYQTTFPNEKYYNEEVSAYCAPTFINLSSD